MGHDRASISVCKHRHAGSLIFPVLDIMTVWLGVRGWDMQVSLLNKATYRTRAVLHVIGGTEKVQPGSMRNITGQLYLGSQFHDNHNWLSPCRSPARAHRSDMTQWMCIDSDLNRCIIYNHCGLQRA